MRTEWAILIISALTDLIISTGTALSAAMVATGEARLPNDAVIILSLVGGLVAAARTIQQALKATPETIAKLKGKD